MPLPLHLPDHPMPRPTPRCQWAWGSPCVCRCQDLGYWTDVGVAEMAGLVERTQSLLWARGLSRGHACPARASSPTLAMATPPGVPGGPSAVTVDKLSPEPQEGGEGENRERGTLRPGRTRAAPPAAPTRPQAPSASDLEAALF